MNVVLDPSLLFITIEKWNNEENRDFFISKLLDFLDYIDEHDGMQIYWNDNMELLLWESKILPWKQDKDFYLHSVSTISHKLHNNIVLLDGGFVPAKCEPDFAFEFNNIEILNEFLSIIHEIIHMGINIFLCVSSSNNKMLKFTCRCNSNELIPRIVKEINDFTNLEEIIQLQWNNLSSKSFIEMIDLIHCHYFLNKDNYIYSYSISSTFIKDIEKENRLSVQCQIVKQIIKKLTMSYRHSQEDPTLQDEMISKKEGRFRVSQRPTSRRIHYTYKNNHIELIHYYPEGEHAFGLRNTK